MSEKYFLRYRDNVIGVIELDESKEFKFTPLDSAKNLPYDAGYPLGLYPLNKKSKRLEPIKEYLPTSKDVLNWLASRVFPKEREGSEGLLSKIGLGRYDVWEIAKKTNAISFNDFYWISKNPSEKFKNNNPRCEYSRVRKVRLGDKGVFRIIAISPKNLKEDCEENENRFHGMGSFT